MKKHLNIKRSHFSPLAAKLILEAVAFGLLLSLIIVYMGYRHFSNVFDTQYNRMTTQFAYISASYITGDAINRCVLGKISDAEYNEIYDKLMEVTNVADLECISVTIPDTIKYETQTYIFHTVNAKLADKIHAFKFDETESLIDKTNEAIIHIKRLMQLGNIYSERNIYRNPYGRLSGSVATSLPIRDRYNNIVAMLSVVKSIDEVIAVEAVYFRRIMLVAFIVSLIFIVGYSIALWRMIISPILTIKGETSYFAQNNALSGILTKIKNKDEIGSLAKSVTDMSEKINQYIAELTTVTADKERISTELNVATDIQMSMLRTDYPAYPDRHDFDVFASMSPAKEVGGDLYDYMLVDDDRLMMCVGDVSGKGVPAALFMMIAKILLTDNSAIGLSPADVMTLVNNRLCQNNDAGLFVTCWLGILTFSTGELCFVNAGHTSPVLYHDGKFEYVKTKPNLVLGYMEGIPYTEHSIKMTKGDRLFVYSDGVTEATDTHDELYGEERLLAAMEKTRGMGTCDVTKEIRRSIDEFVGEAEQFDDITMLDFIWHEKDNG